MDSQGLIFSIPTKAGRVRVYLSGDAFDRLPAGKRDRRDEAALVLDNIALIRETVADRIVATGFSRAIVTVTAMDIERRLAHRRD